MNRFWYSCLLTLALPFVPLKLLWRGLKQPAYLSHWPERFGFYRQKIIAPVIWLHCVSVGETRAAEPLIKALTIAYPQHDILLTHGTPTGRDTSLALFGGKITSVYLPYDYNFAVKKFLRYFKPQIGLIMETELWFNLIAACKKHKIPLLLVNARLSEKSLNGYQKLGNLVQTGIKNLSAIAVQGLDDAANFKGLGANTVNVFGNLKFDVKPPASAVVLGKELREHFGENRTVFLAASTREGEEELIIDAVKDLDILTVIVPRHPERFDEVADLLNKHYLKFMWRSDLQVKTQDNHEVAAKTVPPDCQFVIGNSMNEMFTYYGASDFTFIGGSLLKFGGQNLIEAAAMGVPILIGPHTFNFKEATKTAIRMGAAIRIKDVTSLRENIIALMQNEKKCQKMQRAALNFSATATGATDKTLQLVKQFLRG
jgi:3-deoxy-D-manno-octulosonic-acid transferase